MSDMKRSDSFGYQGTKVEQQNTFDNETAFQKFLEEESKRRLLEADRTREDLPLATEQEEYDEQALSDMYTAAESKTERYYYDNMKLVKDMIKRNEMMLRNSKKEHLEKYLTSSAHSSGGSYSKKPLQAKKQETPLKLKVNKEDLNLIKEIREGFNTLEVNDNARNKYGSKRKQSDSKKHSQRSLNKSCENTSSSKGN